MSNDSDFDAAALAKLRKLGGEEFLRKMIGLFADYAPKRFAAAQTAMAAGDLPAVEKAVHPLKSSAGQIGARQVQNVATEIEKLALARQTDAIPPLLNQLDQAIAQAIARLEQEKQSPPS